VAGGGLEGQEERKGPVAYSGSGWRVNGGLEGQWHSARGEGVTRGGGRGRGIDWGRGGGRGRKREGLWGRCRKGGRCL